MGTNKGFLTFIEPSRVTGLRMTATMRAQEPIPVMSPSKLGEYTVIQEIAEGTFGKVKSMYYHISSLCLELTVMAWPIL
jgi:hypothetical protein